MNNIIIEFCPEDRARVDRLIAALENHAGQACAASVGKMCAASVGKMCADMCDVMSQTAPQTPQSDAAPGEPTAAETPAPALVEAPGEVTSEDIQKKIIELATSGKKKEARAIVNCYAERVSEIPTDKLGEVMAQLNAL